jgi:hypothetical protein
LVWVNDVRHDYKGVEGPAVAALLTPYVPTRKVARVNMRPDLIGGLPSLRPTPPGSESKGFSGGKVIGLNATARTAIEKLKLGYCESANCSDTIPVNRTRKFRPEVDLSRWLLSQSHFDGVEAKPDILGRTCDTNREVVLCKGSLEDQGAKNVLIIRPS